MKIYHVFLPLFLTAGWMLTPSVKGQISDPVRDYLQMDVVGRHEFLDGYSIIYRATCDINNDGKNEVLIGTKYDQSGSKSTYWVVYSEIGSRYVRLSPPDMDIPINLGDAFVGPVSEKQKEGLLEAADPVKDNDRGPVAFQKVSLFSIADGKLLEERLAPLDLRSSADEVFCEKYFGEGRKTRSIKIETLTTDELRRSGYIIPTWQPPSSP
jgi:hypothetical protein